MSNTFSKKEIATLLPGATVLGAGGGGSLQVAKTALDKLFDESTSVPVVALDDLPDNGDWASVAADLGSPDVIKDHPEEVMAAANAVDVMADMCAQRAAVGDERFADYKSMSYTMPVEIGAINSLVPLAIAANRSISCVDADGAGRAVPTLPLTTFARQIALYPNVFASPKGDHALAAPVNQQPFTFFTASVTSETELEAASLRELVDLKGTSKVFGDILGLAIYAANGETLRTHPPVRSGLTDSFAIGEILATKSGGDRVAGIVTYATAQMGRQAKTLLAGKVTDMKLTTEGLDKGHVTVTGDNGDTLKIIIQNENIYAEKNGGTTPYIMGPDSICYVTPSGDVFDNSDLHSLYEKDERPEVSVIGISAPDVVRHNKGLMDAWAQERAELGYSGAFAQPWLDQ